MSMNLYFAAPHPDHEGITGLSVECISGEYAWYGISHADTGTDSTGLLYFIQKNSHHKQ